MSALELVTIAPGFQLAPGPAVAWLRAVAAGCPVTITSAYRSRERQARMRAEYLAARARGLKVAFVAAVEDSEHVTGEALDLKDPAIAWMRAHPAYGFVFTDPSERWHVAYRIGRDEHLADGAAAPAGPAAPHPTRPMLEEDDDAMKDLILACYRQISLYEPAPNEVDTVLRTMATKTRADVEPWFWAQPVADRTLDALYRHHLGRPADAGAQAAWRGKTNRAAADGIANSPEATARRP